jgi:hypothetical protein
MLLAELRQQGPHVAGGRHRRQGLLGPVSGGGIQPSRGKGQGYELAQQVQAGFDVSFG